LRPARPGSPRRPSSNDLSAAVCRSASELSGRFRLNRRGLAGVPVGWPDHPRGFLAGSSSARGPRGSERRSAPPNRRVNPADPGAASIYRYGPLRRAAAGRRTRLHQARRARIAGQAPRRLEHGRSRLSSTAVDSPMWSFGVTTRASCGLSTQPRTRRRRAPGPQGLVSRSHRFTRHPGYRTRSRRSNAWNCVVGLDEAVVRRACRSREPHKPGPTAPRQREDSGPGRARPERSPTSAAAGRLTSGLDRESSFDARRLPNPPDIQDRRRGDPPAASPSAQPDTAGT